jgi:hypothetical protein
VLFGGKLLPNLDLDESFPQIFLAKMGFLDDLPLLDPLIYRLSFKCHPIFKNSKKYFISS